MKIIRNTPATRWGEAFPLGNGHMGAMVYGKVGLEQIDLSELTFFSGNKSEGNNQPEASKAFSKMRKEALAEDFEAMTQTAEQVIGVRDNYGTNLPVGQLLIKTNMHAESLSNYQRELDLRHGVANLSYEYEESKISHLIKSNCYTSNVHQVMVYQIKVNSQELEVDISFESLRESESSQYQTDGGYFSCQALEKIHSDGTTGVCLEGGFLATSDGICEPDSKGLHIKAASKVTIYLAMATDFGGNFDNTKNKGTVEERLTKAKELEYEKLIDSHKRDMARLFDRSELSLSGNDKWAAEIPLMYQMGRYLLYSSSRENSPLPTHLQGIWNDNVACRIGWTCDMHLDVNTQMNYWPAEITNLPEISKPLFRWMADELVPNGRQSAKETYGLPGWSAELVSNAWGFAAPYWAESIAPCPGCGIWILTHLWEHYRYSEDKEYLQNEVFAIIEEAINFFVNYVFEDKDGYITSGPSISPENGFIKEGKIYHNSIGCTFEILMIRELFTIYQEACEVLEKRTKLLESVQEKLPNLLPYRVLTDGTIAEWGHDYEPADAQHRHASHLLGVFPFGQITPEQEGLAEAAKLTMERKLNPPKNWEDTGWARSMMMLYEARLLRPLQAYGHIQAMLENLLEPNGMIIHPPTRGAASFDNVYELDGNTGLTTCIAEMLLQSHRDFIHILPCLPFEWKSGKITGLRARGNLTMTICWDEQRVAVDVKGGRAGSYKFCYKGQERKVVLLANQETRIEFLSE